MLKQIPCLGNAITWEGVKPNLKKILDNMDTGRPTTK